MSNLYKIIGILMVWNILRRKNIMYSNNYAFALPLLDWKSDLVDFTTCFFTYVHVLFQGKG